MAIVRPFKGIRYNYEKVLLRQVIAPPYDVISPDLRDVLVGRSQYNVVNVDLPVGDADKYTVAARTYNEWLGDSVLKKDSEPALYIYEQEYELEGRAYTRVGFVGLLKLEELGAGTVFPHEKTLSGPKKDRFDLMAACKTNFSQIFGLYLDPDDRLRGIYNECMQGMPVASAVDDDKVKHSIWAVDNPKTVQEIQSFMKDKAIYIADGHHRYETALMYRDKMREENQDADGETKPYDFVMMMFVNFYDPGLLILPTHRVVDVEASITEDKLLENLKNDFNITKLDDNDDAIDAFLESHKEPGVIVMLTTKGAYGLLIDQEKLESMHPVYREIDTYILEKNILNEYLNIPTEQILAKKGIYFHLTEKEVRDHIDVKGGIGFILRSTSIDTIRKISESGLVMPQKSTYFYPKLATGLLINEL